MRCHRIAGWAVAIEGQLGDWACKLTIVVIRERRIEERKREKGKGEKLKVGGLGKESLRS